MTKGLRELTQNDFNAALEAVLLPDLIDLLSKRTVGHCMRVTDLDRDLMLRLCGALRSRNTGATIVILADEALRHAGKRFVFSMPEFVAGIQFDTVFLIEVNDGEVQQGPYSTGA